MHADHADSVDAGVAAPAAVLATADTTVLRGAVPPPPSDPPVWTAPFTVMLFPRWTARRFHGIRPLAAWLVHLAGLGLLGLATMWLLGRSEAGQLPGWDDIVHATVVVLDQLALETERNIGPFAAVVAAWAVGLEIAVVGLAFAVSAWGARDEPLRASFGHAVRRTWLISAGAWIPVLVAGFSGVRLDELRSHWYTSAPSLTPATPVAPPVYPTIPPTDPNYSKAMAEYQQAFAAYQTAVAPSAAQWRAWQTWQARQPWYIRHAELLIALLGFIAGAWFFWAWLRGVGSPREVAAHRLDPMCEACGYNLTTLPLEGRCPECGEPVMNSLGPAVRPGTPWDMAGRLHTPAVPAWWRCFSLAMREPGRFARSMRAAPPTPRHRSFMAWTLSLVFVIAFASIPLAIILVGPGGELYDHFAEFLLSSSMFALTCVVGAVLVSCLAALLVGGLMGHRQGRNLLPVAMQMACYLSGFLVCWEIIAAAVSILTIALGESGFFEAADAATGIWQGFLVMFTWLAPNLVCAGVYLLLLTRGAAAARYANR